MKRLGLLLWLLPLTTSAANWPELVDRHIAEAKRETARASIQQLLAASNTGAALIVDVREPHEYQAGHVPGAINIPRGLLEFRIWRHLGWPDATEPRRPVLLYCQLSGRAALGARSLNQLGIENARWVDMQWPQWEAADYPVDF